ncbi:MAG: SIMPL domain-containing protein [Erythrobacter sp.]
MIRRLAAFAAVALAVPMALPTAAHAATIEIESDGPVIELSIDESIDSEPDLLTIGAGVSTDAPTAVEALRQNATQMTRVVDAIKAQGVADKDIRTSGISLNAKYDYNRATQENEFKGYTASNQVSVKLREIAETGKVLDALVVAGATNLNGPTFALEDDAGLKEEARTRAVERGKARAAEYAAMLGYDDFRVLEISESIMTRGRPILSRTEANYASVAAEPTAPVQPGLISTGVSLTIKYEMIDGDSEAEGGEE